MYLNKDKMFKVANHKKNKNYYEYLGLSYLMNDIHSKENGGKKSFFEKHKASILYILERRHVYGGQLQKEWRLL